MTAPDDVMDRDRGAAGKDRCGRNSVDEPLPNLRRISLDEWLSEHQDALTAEKRREGILIPEMEC